MEQSELHAEQNNSTKKSKPKRWIKRLIAFLLISLLLFIAFKAFVLSFDGEWFDYYHLDLDRLARIESYGSIYTKIPTDSFLESIGIDFYSYKQAVAYYSETDTYIILIEAYSSSSVESGKKALERAFQDYSLIDMIDYSMFDSTIYGICASNGYSLLSWSQRSRVMGSHNPQFAIELIDRMKSKHFVFVH